MKEEELFGLRSQLSQNKKVVIIPHKNADGDALGSTLALRFFLNKKGHECTVISPNDYPDFLKWLPGENEIVNFEADEPRATQLLNDADLIFTLDFNALDRAGNMKNLIKKSACPKVMIDHHQQPEDYAQFMYSDPSMSSTCEMVYHFINLLGEKELIDADIATCIYTGILTDTGSFKYAATTSVTHQVVADLLKKGAKNTEIQHHLYHNNSALQLKLLGYVLQRMVFLRNYETVYMALSREELKKFNYRKGDTEGLVNYGLTIKDVKLAVIFIEDTKEDFIKISFRSLDDFSVNNFARTFFGGGGHKNASGGRSYKSLSETIAYFIESLEQLNPVASS